MSGTEIAQALTKLMGLGAQGGGAERVLAPLLYPVFCRLAVALSIACSLLSLVEGEADVAVTNAGNRT